MKKKFSYPENHQKALDELYEKAGVGKTYKQRHAYWNSVEPNTSISHFDLNDHIHRTRAFEMCWLTMHFPQDFNFC